MWKKEQPKALSFTTRLARITRPLLMTPQAQLHTHEQLMRTREYAEASDALARQAAAWLDAPGQHFETERAALLQRVETLIRAGQRGFEQASRYEDILEPDAPHTYEHREVREPEYTYDSLHAQALVVVAKWLRDAQPPAATAVVRPIVQPLPAPPAAAGIVVKFPPEGFYESKEWHATAAATKQRWNYECALNAAHTGPVEAHHRTYANLGAEEERDTIPLCAECHERHHDHMPQPRLIQKKAA